MRRSKQARFHLQKHRRDGVLVCGFFGGMAKGEGAGPFYLIRAFSRRICGSLDFPIEPAYLVQIYLERRCCKFHVGFQFYTTKTCKITFSTPWLEERVEGCA